MYLYNVLSWLSIYKVTDRLITDKNATKKGLSMIKPVAATDGLHR